MESKKKGIGIKLEEEKKRKTRPKRALDAIVMTIMFWDVF